MGCGRRRSFNLNLIPNLKDKDKDRETTKDRKEAVSEKIKKEK